jgi:hypothetical protein
VQAANLFARDCAPPANTANRIIDFDKSCFLRGRHHPHQVKPGNQRSPDCLSHGCKLHYSGYAKYHRNIQQSTLWVRWPHATP